MTRPQRRALRELQGRSANVSGTIERAARTFERTSRKRAAGRQADLDSDPSQHRSQDLESPSGTDLKYLAGNKHFLFETRLRGGWLKRQRKTEISKRACGTKSKVVSRMWFQIFCSSVGTSQTEKSVSEFGPKNLIFYFQDQSIPRRAHKI